MLHRFNFLGVGCKSLGCHSEAPQRDLRRSKNAFLWANVKPACASAARTCSNVVLWLIRSLVAITMSSCIIIALGMLARIGRSF